MGLDENIYDLRREKLKKIEALGQPTYRTKYEFTHTVEQILADYSPKSAEGKLDRCAVKKLGFRAVSRLRSIFLSFSRRRS